MATLKIILRRARTLLWTAFSIVVILAAVGVGIGKLLMPYSDRYQPRLEAWLSEEFGRQVRLESFEGDWTAFGPRLSLQGMVLMSPEAELMEGDPAGEGAVAIESAALDIRPLNMLLPGRPLYNFRVIGADFELRHTVEGRFELSGFGVSHRGDGSEQSALKELATVGEVVLQDSNLVYQDEKVGVLLAFDGINGRLHMEGDALATEISARFHDARSELVYGEIEATMLVTLDDDQKMVEMSWQASARELMLAAFQGRLPSNPFLPLTGWLNAELWGDWTRPEGHSIRGVTDLSEARLVNEHQDLRLDRVSYRFNWTWRDRGDWDLHLADLLYDDGVKAWTAPRISMARDTANDLGLWISADELPLDVPLNLARDVMSIYGTAWPAFLPGRAAGSVSDLDLALDSGWKLRLARGTVSDASVLDWDRWPDLQGLNGRVALQRGTGLLHLSGEAVVADWPRMFREPLSLEIPQCRVDLVWGAGWQVGFDDCRLENEDLAAEAAVLITGDEGKPRVDVNVALTRGNIAAFDAYWPEAILKDTVKSWLRSGLVGGTVTSGRFQIHGDMDHWPFRDGRGRFEAVAEVADAVIDYYPGWPRAQQVDARVTFVGAEMEVEGRVDAIGGVPVREARATIDDMKSPLLTVSYAADSELPELIRFLEQTPLAEQIDTDLSTFTFRGDASTHGVLTVPMGNREGGLQLAGRVDLPAAHFYDPASDIALENIVGSLEYDEQGFEGRELDCNYRGHPASLNLAAGVGREERFRADLVGIFDIRDVIPEFLMQSYPEFARVEGACLWQAALTVAPDPAGVNETLLSVESQLLGVELNLPAPLRKPAGAAWPLKLRLPLSGDSHLLDVSFEDRLAMRFELPELDAAPVRASIWLGPGEPMMPPGSLIRIDGRSEDVDLDGWIDVVIDGAEQGRGLGGLDLEQGGFTAGNMLFLDRNFSDVSVNFDVIETDIRAEFDAEDIDGKVRFTTGEAGMNSLSAEFERLALADPVSGGMDMDSNPADLPALHLYARSFRYAGVELGETRIEAYPTTEGFHFEKVDASSEQLSVQARGDWSLGEAGQRSDFEIRMTSESLGEFLQSMDISSSMEGGQTLVNFSAWWPGSPATFALSRLNGEIDFSVVDGNITNASAGTGRLLGLLSVQALPRRLALDFRDVFDSGFSFEEAAGTFQMENGTARTDDVKLSSSAASISVSGSTNLVEQTYDQLLTIRPGLGNTLPIIGAIAAGPGGAAAGLALQGLLHEQLGEATQVQYTITGSWDEPLFEAVDVERVEPQEDTEQQAATVEEDSNES